MNTSETSIVIAAATMVLVGIVLGGSTYIFHWLGRVRRRSST